MQTYMPHYCAISQIVQWCFSESIVIFTVLIWVLIIVYHLFAILIFCLIWKCMSYLTLRLFAKILTLFILFPSGAIFLTLLTFTTLWPYTLAHDQSTSSSISTSSTSVHRFSNLYGTVLSCADYLSTTFHAHADKPQQSSGSSVPLSPQFTINGVQLDLRTLLRSHLLNYRDDIRDQQQHNSHLHHSSNNRFNVTIRWEVRTLETGPNFRSSSQSSSNTPNRAASYELSHDRANLRYSNIFDGTLSFAPFEVGAFVPDIHDAFYRCLLHLPQGVLASREVRVQAGRWF